MIQQLGGVKFQDLWTSIKDVIKSLGLVFGDIGTSPIYTLSIIFLNTALTPTNIIGVLSVVVWTLTLLVFVMYVLFAMSLGKKGEGGTIVLKEILVPMLKSTRQIGFITILSYVGISLLFGDGVITPAISILSAVEGLRYIPFFSELQTLSIVMIASFIALILFVIQKHGTDKISIAFGPLMLIWFIVLSLSGLSAITQNPSVLKAFNPWYALNFMYENGLAGFFVLSDVILCATGGEGLYADMGHLGRKPIQRASVLVFFSLLLTYMGQAAYLLDHPKTKNVMYELILHQAQDLYIPFLILSIFATVIASQAIISGIYSAVYQGITTRILPTFKVDYTSSRFRSQIYVGCVNWFLLVFVLYLIFHFKATSRIAAAYGFAVTGSMCITGIMMTWIFWLKKYYLKSIVTAFLMSIGFLFFCSNIFKIPYGGYWSVILALLPLTMIIIYTQGKKRQNRALRPIPLESFLERYRETYQQTTHIAGSALFFTRDLSKIAPYTDQIMFKNNIIYEDNILVSIITRDDPFGVIGFFKGDLAPGLRIFEIHMGYMELIDIEKILNNAGINAKVIFYGLEDVITKNPIWKIYAFIKRITPPFVRFHKLPTFKLHGVINQVKI